MVYPALPSVVVKHCQGGPSYQVLEWESTLFYQSFGLSKPLLCSLISSAICFHDDASVPFGVGGQKMGNALTGSSIFMYNVSFFLSFSFSHSSLFWFLSRCKGLSPD